MSYIQAVALSAITGAPESQVRLSRIWDAFKDIFGYSGKFVFSSPGRTEICGNHTDHNNGLVLCGAVNLDMLACVSPNDTGIIRLHSVSHAPAIVDIRQTEPVAAEIGQSPSLVRGVAALLQKEGYTVGGFDCYMESLVPAGSGLSSSAAFEVLIAAIENHFYNNGNIPPELCARIGQGAENIYFGKPSGLMDQTASAVGGLMGIDFAEPSSPVITRIPFDFSSTGHRVCLVNTGGTHASLTEEYSSIREDMKRVSEFFGQASLRGVTSEDILKNISALRECTGDRAIMRALHYIDENARVKALIAALADSDFSTFLDGIRESGRSSFMYLQNVYSAAAADTQPTSLALCLCSQLLKDRGAYRIHGGGFAGSIQAFVPDDLLYAFSSQMETAFGNGCCHTAMIRPYGAVLIDE